MMVTILREFRDSIPYGEKYGPAMKIEDQDEANIYFAYCVRHQMRLVQRNGRKINQQEAEAIERENLAYWAGYSDDETRKRVERLFKTKHPIFGAIAESGSMDPGKAFEIGMKAGKAARNES